MTKPTEREIEQAFIDVMNATDGTGLLRVRLLGEGDSPMEQVHFALAGLLRWFTNEAGVALPDLNSRVTRLRHLELLARAYRLALEGVPRHSGHCSNQNVLDPLGAYKGVEACGCNR